MHDQVPSEEGAEHAGNHRKQKHIDLGARKIPIRKNFHRAKLIVTIGAPKRPFDAMVKGAEEDQGPTPKRA